MPDVFDQVATDSAPAGGDIFDQVGSGEGDIFDQVTAPPAAPSLNPATEGTVKEITTHAKEGAMDVVRGFIHGLVPKTDLLSLTEAMVPPAMGPIEAYRQAKGVVDTVQQVHAAEQTPPFSRERFAAGFGVASQLGLMAVGGKAGEEILPETIPKGGEITDASAKRSTTQILEHGDGPQVGEETPLRQQGTPAGAQPQGAEPVSTGEPMAAEVPAGEHAPGAGTGQVTLYHATSGEFDRFDPEKQTQTGLGGKGTYFSADKGDAQKAYGKNVVSVNVPEGKIANLAELEKQAGGPKTDSEIQKAGYEGTFNPSTGEYVLYNPNKFLTGEVEPVRVQSPTTSTKNAIVAEERARRGIAPAIESARRDFGTVWDDAAKIESTDPNVGQRLVEEINSTGKIPGNIDADTANAILLRKQIAAHAEHGLAVDAVNVAKTPEDLTAANARLSVARDQLQSIYDADKKAGTALGRGLNARQMMATEDYSLAKMEARRRAANEGKPLSEEQLKETSGFQKQISDLQARINELERTRKSPEYDFDKALRDVGIEARQPRFGRDFTKFLDEKAAKARERIIARRGRLNVGADPGALVDEAIIGASHIAKGLTKFADWSVQMVKDFGERIKPFLEDLWKRSSAYHSAAAKAARTPQEVKLARYKTKLATETIGVQAKLERGDLTKEARVPTQLDKAAFQMRSNLQNLKNQFEQKVAQEAYAKKTPSQKFWDHFVGVERAMKLSGPEVFGKLGVAAFAREALRPIETAGGYGVSKMLPRLTAGTRYGADFKTALRSELKAKAAFFTTGMKDAWENVKGKETELESIGKKQAKPEFWYNRIGKMHAAVKAPVKRAAFTQSLEVRMGNAVKAGEDINHPAVMERLANEAVMDANREIFRENTVVSQFFNLIDKKSPVGGRVARFLFPVVKIPTNIFKELVNLHVGAPVGAARIGAAYWKGIETLPVLQREAIVRQLVKGSIGGAGLLWGYFNSDKVRSFYDSMPTFVQHSFEHTPFAAILNEGSYLKEAFGDNPKQASKELRYMAKTTIPFAYTITDAADALGQHSSQAISKWINNMIASTTVPQLVQQTAKYMDKPSMSERPTYRIARNPIEAIELGIPGLRQQVPEKSTSGGKGFGPPGGGKGFGPP